MNAGLRIFSHAVILLFILGNLTLFPSSATAGTGYSCLFTSDTITLDGEWNEPAWQKALVLRFFVPPGGTKPLSPTEGRLLWDHRYLYVGFKAYDKDIMGSFTQRDSPTFREDVLEIFFKPSDQNGCYYNFEINALGTVYDALNDKTLNKAHDKGWNCGGLLLKIIINGTMNEKLDEDDSWQMEVAIPWEDLPSLEGRKPRSGDVWLFHLARYDYSQYLPEGVELSSCAPLTRVNFHNFREWISLEFRGK